MVVSPCITATVLFANQNPLVFKAEYDETLASVGNRQYTLKLMVHKSWVNS